MLSVRVCVCPTKYKSKEHILIFNLKLPGVVSNYYEEPESFMCGVIEIRLKRRKATRSKIE